MVVRWSGLPSMASRKASAWSLNLVSISSAKSCSSLANRSVSHRPESSSANWSWATVSSSLRFPFVPIISTEHSFGFWNWFMTICAMAPEAKRRLISAESSTSVSSKTSLSYMADTSATGPIIQSSRSIMWVATSRITPPPVSFLA